MTDRTTLLALAARCEQAAEPDRELDGAAWCAANGYPFVKWDGAGVVWRGADGSIRHYPASRVPFYTASLDAAVMLVPEGWTWVMASYGNARAYQDQTAGKSFIGENAKPALALCAAALRAGAAMVQPSSDT
jgi:hypothetical protein